MSNSFCGRRRRRNPLLTVSSSAEVYRGLYKGQHVAVKRYFHEHFNEEKYQCFLDEIAVIRYLVITSIDI